LKINYICAIYIKYNANAFDSYAFGDVVNAEYS